MKTEKSECRHRWGALLARYRGKDLPVPYVRACFKCGFIKIGLRTIKLSKNRLDMDNKPIQNAGKVLINNRLKVPVGTNLYD